MGPFTVPGAGIQQLKVPIELQFCCTELSPMVISSYKNKREVKRPIDGEDVGI